MDVTTGRAVRDPVCLLDVPPRHASGGGAEHAGVTYWFCSPACRERFVADPARFAPGSRTAR